MGLKVTLHLKTKCMLNTNLATEFKIKQIEEKKQQLHIIIMRLNISLVLVGISNVTMHF